MGNRTIGRYIITDTKICHGQPVFRGTRAISTTNGRESEEFFNQLIELQVRVLEGDKSLIMEKIRELIPTYNPTFVEPRQNRGYPGVVSSLQKRWF